jgi:hypothetical protein
MPHRIPVYVINALYLWPITLWTYLKYGRPPKLEPRNKPPPEHAHHSPYATSGAGAGEAHAAEGELSNASGKGISETGNSTPHHGHNMAAMNHERGGEMPIFASITIAVCHCGAGCVLGDLIGEWLVYGANVTINGRTLWPEFLIGTVLLNPVLRTQSRAYILK